MGKKKGKSKNAAAAKAKQAEPESVKGAKEDVLNEEGESHVAGTSTVQDAGPGITSEDKSEASDGAMGTPGDLSGAVTPSAELDSATNTTEGVADDAIAKSVDMQDNADETRDLPSVVANPGEPLQEILEEPVGEREQHATAQAVTEQTEQDDPKSPVKRPGSPSREDTSADTGLAHDASIIASPPASRSAMAESPKASDAPLDKVKVDVSQGNERDTGMAANFADGNSTPDDLVGTPAVDRQTAGDDSEVSPVRADYLAPADQTEAVDHASHTEGDISLSPTEPSLTFLGSAGAEDSPIRHSDESQRGAEIGTPRPAIFRKRSEEDIWGSKRMTAEGDADTGVDEDGDIGLSNELAEIELDGRDDVQVDQGANAAVGGSIDVEEDHQAAQTGVLGNQRDVERDGHGSTIAEHEEEDDTGTSRAVGTSGKIGDEQADGARPERRRDSATSMRSVALGRDAEEDGYREASTQDTDNEDSPPSPVSAGRAASPIPSKHDSLSRDYDTTANSDELAFRNQGFRSVKPSASEKPHIPMSRPIAIDLSHDGDGDEGDMGDMTEVQISHSPNQNGRSDASEAATDGMKSPSKRGWFSFGRKSSQTGSANGASAAAASAEQEIEIPDGYQRPPTEGYAAPPMSSLSISAHSVHSIHSVHSVHSGRSRVGSTGESGQASTSGSRRPSELASPAPHSAGSELGTQASTPRRAAPPPRPFPAELLAQAEKEKEERDKASPSAIPVSESAVNAGNAPLSPPDPTSDSAAGAAAPSSVAAAVATIVPQPDATADASASAAGPSTSTTAAKVDHGIGAKGISTFEKVLNYTRPQHLPPKTREEDDTHYHQWEEMMAVARQHQAEKRKAAEVRRLEKEKKLAAYTPKWEMLLQGGQPSIGQVREDEGLRKMWFEGVPGHLRNKAWSAAIGNPLAMSKDAYRSYVARANKAISSGRFPQDTLDAIERDMSNTLPQTKMFVAGSPMRVDLKELLTAWVVYRSDDGLGYAPYVSHIAAMLLIPSPPAQAFLNLVNLLSRSCLRAFVTETKDEIDAFYRVFENLQADTFPKIYANCSNLGLRLPQSYFRSVLVEQVPFEACCRLWDQIMLDGDGYIFRSALAIFGFLEPRLHYPDKEEILSVLEGRNKATHAITEREKERARLRGEAYDDELDGKLSVFGLNEDALFEWLARDEWKEARYERLVTREMPD